MLVDNDSSSTSYVPRELIVLLRQNFALDWHGHHGGSHWSRVRLNGLALAKETGADCVVVEFFAFLHDSCRENEHADPGHGGRAANLVLGLPNKLLPLSDTQRECLAEACRGHTGGTHHDNPTVATCWDADRLDLIRVGIETDPALLLTTSARSPHMIDRARSRAEAWLEKRYVGRER